MLFKLNKDIHDYNDLSTFRMFKSVFLFKYHLKLGYYKLGLKIILITKGQGPGVGLILCNVNVKLVSLPAFY